MSYNFLRMKSSLFLFLFFIFFFFYHTPPFPSSSLFFLLLPSISFFNERNVRGGEREDEEG